MTKTNKTDHLLNAITDADHQFALNFLANSSAENIKPHHFEGLIGQYRKNISGIAVSLGYTKNQYTEIADILAKKADDKTLQDVKELTSNKKTVEQQFDEELGDVEVDSKREKINQVINKIVVDELKIRADKKLAQNDPLLHAIKGSDKYKAIDLVKTEDIKSHHLAAAIEEYYKGSSNETIPSLVRSEEKSVMKALIEKASDDVLKENRQYKIKEATYIEHGNLEAGSMKEKFPAEYIEVKEVTAELNKRGIEESGHTASANKQTVYKAR